MIFKKKKVFMFFDVTQQLYVSPSLSTSSGCCAHWKLRKDRRLSISSCGYPDAKKGIELMTFGDVELS